MSAQDRYPPASRRWREKLYDHLRSLCAAPGVSILRRRARSIKAVPSGGLVVVAPHPDDESLGCGGLIALKRSRGESVHIIFLTSGESSLPAHPVVTPKFLATRREEEAIAALHALGVDSESVHFARASDGILGRLDAASRARVVTTLAKFIVNHRPTVIATTFRRDGHPDHEAAYTLTKEAAMDAASSAEIWEYPLWSLWMLTCSQLGHPDFGNFQRLDVRSVLNRKRGAIACHITQVAPVSPWHRPTLSSRFVGRIINADELFRRSVLNEAPRPRKAD